ncbi:MAG: hypothetical protein ABIY55_00135 [Kofleriaceae bacterium]
MRCAPAISMAAAGLAAAFASPACTGSLREQIGRSELDASVLTTIQPPPCDDPATAPDPGVCLGGAQPGDDCLMCHRQGGAAAPYTFAGTLYDAGGTQPVAGATIYVQDTAGNIATAITRANGNFFTAEGFVQYPAKAFVSRCPDVIAMLGAVDDVTGANCNTSGCHTAGFRVHVP